MKPGDISLYTAVNIHDYREMLETSGAKRIRHRIGLHLSIVVVADWLAVHSYTSLPIAVC